MTILVYFKGNRNGGERNWKGSVEETVGWAIFLVSFWKGKQRGYDAPHINMRPIVG